MKTPVILLEDEPFSLYGDRFIAWAIIMILFVFIINWLIEQKEHAANMCYVYVNNAETKSKIYDDKFDKNKYNIIV